MYCQHRTRGLSQDPFGHGPYHQPVKPAPSVSSHDDQIHVLRLGQREYAVCRYSLLDHRFRPNFTVGTVLHESFELLLAFTEKMALELDIIVRRDKSGLGMLP
jgi:hypothetical protein